MAGLPPLLMAVLVLTLDNANAQEIEDGELPMISEEYLASRVPYLVRYV